MDTDKALYNRYQNEISDYETFKGIKSKKLKTMLFTGWVTQFGSKAIREKMNIPYSTYDYNSRAYGPGSDPEAEDKPRKGKRTIIDVEGFTQPEPPKEEPIQEPQPITEKNQIALIEQTAASKEPTEAPRVTKTPFISVEWANTPETLKSQLEAIANVLLFEKGEITVKLEVFKNS